MTVPPPQSGYEWETAPTPRPAPAAEPEPAADWAEALAEQEIWRVMPSRHRAGGALEPFSQKWFQHLEKKRYRRHGQWVTDLLEPNRRAKGNVLAVGDGLGTDWAQLASPETTVAVVETDADRVSMYRKHFAVRNSAINVHHAPWEHLPLGDDRTDVAILFFHQAPAGDLAALVREALRVLRPGGKIIAVVPGKFNAGRWQDIALPWRWVRAKAKNRHLYTAAGLKDLFGGCENINVRKRHLRRSELPYLWRWLPLPILERVMGRFLVLKAFKPLQQASPVRLAA